MEREIFQRLLFRVAFCLMACDGHIDEREIKEMKEMNKSASYFNGIDLSDELNSLLLSLKKQGKQIVDSLLNDIHKYELSTVQELLILEVSFRIIYADTKVDENEVKFLKHLRSKLKVFDEIIRQRFGNVEYLFGTNNTMNIDVENKDSVLDVLLKFDTLETLDNIDFSMFKDK